MEGRLLEILHFQKGSKEKQRILKIVSNIEANVCFNLLDEEAEDDDSVAVL